MRNGPRKKVVATPLATHRPVQPMCGILPFTHLAREAVWQSPSDVGKCWRHSARRCV